MSLVAEPSPNHLLQEKCVYCGLGELELCSPFVVGQSRAEHEAVLQLAQQKATADNFFPGVTGTTVVFLNEVRLRFVFLPSALCCFSV